MNENLITLIPLEIKRNLGKCLEMVICYVVVRDSRGHSFILGHLLFYLFFFLGEKKERKAKQVLVRWFSGQR